jgi:phosphatidylinositol-3,4,5-trisphosphate 3-phosphatase/dual-specificity protein phosphatase PTEN
MQFYARRRFEKDGYGVTQPCQIKYIEYFHNFLCSPKIYPQVLSLQKITFKGDFDIKNPYIKLINNSTNKTIYNTREF